MTQERYQREGQPGGEARSEPARPLPSLRVVDAVALVVGIVVGAGIFRTPSLVAQNAAGPATVLLLWGLGGLVSLIGAMCYAELASTWPHAGGDYHYLRRALGSSLAFLFAWARLTVIPTGSIALLGFIFGDYASQLLPLGEHSSALYAALSVVVLTGLNVAGIQLGKWTQNLLTVAVVAGLGLVIFAGFFAVPSAAPAPAAAVSSGAAPHAAWGMAMVFVLLTYGGWNEAAYISSELRGGRRSIVSALLWSMVAVTALYLLANAAYLRGLGMAGVARSDAVAAELMQRVAGPWGARLISALICAAVLTSANATVLMGSRTHYAMGRDFPLFSPLGRWSARASAPVNALLVQGAISLTLVGVGFITRRGFETMVDYTAPVFWFFFLLVGVSLLVLRRREPHVARPFRVPLYPLVPLLFCASCAYLLYSSLAYTGAGALVGVAVLATGLVPLALMRRRAGHPRSNPLPGGRKSWGFGRPRSV
ncbi:amino acid transporter [Archangium gephyra]|uniref:Amino acid transporter n=1 Tax=Archangium gephyra TaxID=48 RepID=A0AAC8QG36_9BACT|nr:APC family permease [Archangium gephyra]AKJ06794.1 amino acid transporter [Archangium gephyra]REG31909.1 amino acid transporter [Archangium gephyra]